MAEQKRTRSLQPCRYFFGRGGCRRGANCKFSHDRQSSTQRTSNTTDVQRGSTSELTLEQISFRQWRFLVPLPDKFAHHAQLEPLQLRRLFRDAEALINSGSAEIMQDVITRLASEGGLLRVKQLIDGHKLEQMNAQQALSTFSEQIYPFFRSISHSNVLASLILEEPLGTIYNYLYGPSGARARTLLTFCVKLFSAAEAVPSKDSVQTVLLVVAKIIDGNGQAMVNEDLVTVIERLIDRLSQLSADDSVVRVLLLRIRRRLNIGKGLPSTVSLEPGLSRATFLIPLDPPGHLSTTGVRHDNDHADICNISILPTTEEIKSLRSEYLPPQDPSLLHLQGVDGLLDRHFRLLREDTVGQLRDAIRTELGISGSNARHSGSRTFTYSNLAISDLSFAGRNGLEFLVRVDQINLAQSMTERARKDWWNHSPRLQAEALVCMLSKDGSIDFCTIRATDVILDKKQTSQQNQAAEAAREDDRKGLYTSSEYCYIKLSLLEASIVSVRRLLQMIHSPSAKDRLVEFPGVVLPAFKPCLEALQTMKSMGDLPFADYFAPDAFTGTESIVVEQPKYAMQPGFAFPLQDVLTDEQEMTFSVHRAFDRRHFKANAKLDEAQADALIDTLSRSLALIQGPPGTGKSFTGIALVKILLAVKNDANLGPVICVCYTNHALDQLLEQLHHGGVTQIVRIGSRSKSEVLQSCSLRTVVQQVSMTGPEKHRRYESIGAMRAEEDEMREILQEVPQLRNAKTIQAYLESYYPQHSKQLFGAISEEEEEGWYRVINHKVDPIQDWLRMKQTDAVVSDNTRTLRQIMEVQDVFTLNSAERHKLYQKWLRDIGARTANKIVTTLNEHEKHKKRFDQIRSEMSLRCLQAANVVGVTTTGLARQIDLLRKLRSKVLLCEEAGEVLEAHLLTAMLPSLEHVIMIGDHQQLVPRVQNYDLSRENPSGARYSLDRSLFERLVQPANGLYPALPFSVLETQRRMHPTISELIRTTLYPRLIDSSNVTLYPPITGMKKRLFWMDHSEPEYGAGTDSSVATSHSNSFEVRMVVALVTHLIRQSVYQENEIAVLTPYLGQMLKIRAVLRKSFEITMSEGDIEDIEKQGLDEGAAAPMTNGASQVVAKTSLLKALKVSTVDNFQGEEAKVVVISLVRSNNEQKCGFLRTPNRINVLLSRAQHGMYIIGNSRTSEHVEMWSNVLGILKREGNLGTELELQCPRHLGTSIKVSKPDDFSIFSPEGGCHLHCEDRLPCGHACINKCHSEMLHNAVRCLEDCQRSLKYCEHPCPNRCGDACVLRCKVIRPDNPVPLPCGHVKNDLECWELQAPEAVRCTSMVSKIVPGCGHEIKEQCCINVEAPGFICEALCGTILSCGHACQSSCGRCNSREGGTLLLTKHESCRIVCDRSHNTCSHSCSHVCHPGEPCPPCGKSCEIRCGHSKCTKKCHEPCSPCAEHSCFSTCPHSSCTMPCAAPCNWLPCSKRCSKSLTCGHQCPSLCGEICPSEKFCQICADPDIKEVVVDYIMMSSYSEIDLDEDPCIVPPCGHLLTVSSMDGQMDMSKHYAMDGISASSIVSASESFSMDELKCCAICRGSLGSVARYGRIVRRAMIDQCTKRFITASRTRSIILTQRLHDYINLMINDTKTNPVLQADEDNIIRIQGSRTEQYDQIWKLAKIRYARLMRIRKSIEKHLNSVRVEEQPFQRVADFVRSAKRNCVTVGDFEINPSILQTSEALNVTSMLFRCDLAILSDFLALSSLPDVKLNLVKTRQECCDFAQAAKQAHQPLREVEAHIFYAKFCAAERSHVAITEIDGLMQDARQHLTMAREIRRRYPGSTTLVHNEIDEVDKMLRESTFYSKVKDDEFASVMAAMRHEMPGSGHWYTCENGHPFTVGECGMPMQMARCPQCEARIGGINHQPAEGVSHAHDLERRFGGMSIN